MINTNSFLLEYPAESTQNGNPSTASQMRRPLGRDEQVLLYWTMFIFMTNRLPVPSIRGSCFFSGQPHPVTTTQWVRQMLYSPQPFPLQAEQSPFQPQLVGCTFEMLTTKGTTGLTTGPNVLVSLACRASALVIPLGRVGRGRDRGPSRLKAWHIKSTQMVRDRAPLGQT